MGIHSRDHKASFIDTERRKLTRVQHGIDVYAMKKKVDRWQLLFGYLYDVRLFRSLYPRNVNGVPDDLLILPVSPSNVRKYTIFIEKLAATHLRTNSISSLLSAKMRISIKIHHLLTGRQWLRFYLYLKL